MEEQNYPPPKVLESGEPRKRLLVPTGKRFSAAAVQRMIREYKKRSRQDTALMKKYKKMYEKTWDRYVRVRQSVKKTNKKVWFLVGRERGNKKANTKRMNLRMEKLKIKHKEEMKRYRATIRGKIYKELKNKFKFYDPNQNIDPNYIKVLIWLRIYVKLNYAKRKMKMGYRDIIVLLFLSQFPDGTTNMRFNKEMNLGNISILHFSMRLRKYGLVSRERPEGKRKYTYFLTDRGWRFANSILNFVKKEKTVVKKIKPTYIRRDVSVPGAAASSGHTEQSSSS